MKKADQPRHPPRGEPPFLLQGDAIGELLASARRIAVIGASPRPERPSSWILQYLLDQGFDVLPINPRYDAISGRRCWPSLSEVPEPVDIVDVFRRSDAVEAIVEEAIAHGDRALWLQEGVVNWAAARRAHRAGLAVVMDRCLYRDHLTWTSRSG